MMREKRKGVNLGNWLVLEKWMMPELFAGTDADDEDELCRQLSREELIRRLTMHRDSFITKEDFVWLRRCGIDTVRIPVPHFLFGDDSRWCDPYVACAEYVDRALEWAQETGIQVLIDLHTAPESQNGFDNGGICGVCRWAQSRERIERLLDVLEKIGRRYGEHPALWGVELLNEPVSEAVWLKSSLVYRPKDQERAKGSSFVPVEVLEEFYREGYHRLRNVMGAEKKIIFHDGFRFDHWKHFFEMERFENVVLDVHWYLGMGEPAKCENQQDYVNYILKEYEPKLAWMQETVPVMVGEWCLAHRISETHERTEWEKKLSFRMIAEAQLLAWEDAAGYFFWSYRLKDGPEGWGFRDCVERGWLPGKLK